MRGYFVKFYVLMRNCNFAGRRWLSPEKHIPLPFETAARFAEVLLAGGYAFFSDANRKNIYLGENANLILRRNSFPAPRDDFICDGAENQNKTDPLRSRKQAESSSFDIAAEKFRHKPYCRIRRDIYETFHPFFAFISDKNK